METKGCCNYPETNTSALCTPHPTPAAWRKKTNVLHILGERSFSRRVSIREEYQKRDGEEATQRKVQGTEGHREG